MSSKMPIFNHCLLDRANQLRSAQIKNYPCYTCTPGHLLLDSAPNLGPPISRWEIKKF
jgi:hypothetical protein